MQREQSKAKAETNRDAEAYALGAAFVRNEIVPLLEAGIPIVDMGFLHSDVCYDVVSVWNGRFFRLNEHMDRFERSYQGLGFSLSHTKEQMRQILIDMVARAQLRNAYVFMCATRGVPDLEDPRNMDKYENQFYAFAVDYVWMIDPEEQKIGSDAVISSVPRIPKECVDPTIKNHHWGDLTRADAEAHAKGARTAFLLNLDGTLAEGPGFNVFVIKDGQLLTPNSNCLMGVTRLTMLDLAKEMGMDARECRIPLETLRSADEIFMCTTAGGVMPVRSLDGKPVSSGKPGPITMKLYDAYWKAHERPEWSTPVNYD